MSHTHAFASAFVLLLFFHGSLCKPVQMESLSVPASLPAISLIRSLTNGSVSLATMPQEKNIKSDETALDWPPTDSIDLMRPWMKKDSSAAVKYTAIAYLFPPLNQPGSYFGVSLAFLDPFLIVGAPMTAMSGYVQAGYATIYSRSGFSFGVFALLDAKDARLPQLTNTFYGICVSISLTHAFVAGIDDRYKSGIVAVYNIQGASSRYIQTIASPISQPYAGFGRAICSDERYLYVAAPFQDSNGLARRGSIHVYIRLGITFAKTGEITNNEIGAFSSFGMIIYAEAVADDNFGENSNTIGSKKSYIIVQSLPGTVTLYRESDRGSQPGQFWDALNEIPGRIVTATRNDVFDIHGSYFDNFQTGGVIIKVNNIYLG